MGMRKAIGLGMTILVLKFLMQDAFVAAESALEALFGAAETSFVRIEDTAAYTQARARGLTPQ